MGLAMVVDLIKRPMIPLRSSPKPESSPENAGCHEQVIEQVRIGMPRTVRH